jgi:hypothetical protein
LRQPVNATAETIKLTAADKLGLRHEELVLAEIKSNGIFFFYKVLLWALFDHFRLLILGEKSVIADTEVSIATCLSINGRIFVSPKDHLDAMVRFSFPFQTGIEFLKITFLLMSSLRRCCRTKKGLPMEHAMNWRCSARENWLITSL